MMPACELCHEVLQDGHMLCEINFSPERKISGHYDCVKKSLTAEQVLRAIDLGAMPNFNVENGNWENHNLKSWWEKRRLYKEKMAQQKPIYIGE